MSTKTMQLPRRGNKRKDREGGCDDLKPAQAEPEPPNRILAGYLAHEFLSRGTLFGKPWDPDRAEPEGRAAEGMGRYVEVASLLSLGGAQLEGIVNPTQLTGLLHM